MSIYIRQAELSDCDDIYKIVCSNSMLLGRITPPEIQMYISFKSCLVAVCSDKVVAFCLYLPLKRSPQVTIYAIAVDSDFRRHGIARDMVTYISTSYKSCRIRAVCVKGSLSERFWSKIGTLKGEKQGKVRPLCVYEIKPMLERRYLI